MTWAPFTKQDSLVLPHNLPTHMGRDSKEYALFYFLSKGLLLLLLSHFSPVQLCVTPQKAAHQAPLSLRFSRHEHCSGLPFPSPMHESEKWKWSRSVVSDSWQPHGLQPTRLLRLRPLLFQEIPTSYGEKLHENACKYKYDYDKCNEKSMRLKVKILIKSRTSPLNKCHLCWDWSTGRDFPGHK